MDIYLNLYVSKIRELQKLVKFPLRLSNKKYRLAVCVTETAGIISIIIKSNHYYQNYSELLEIKGMVRFQHSVCGRICLLKDSQNIRRLCYQFQEKIKKGQWFPTIQIDNSVGDEILLIEFSQLVQVMKNHF